MPRPPCMHLPSLNAINFNPRVAKMSPGCPSPRSLSPGPPRPHPAPPAPARERPQNRRPWRRAPAEPRLPPRCARRADWLRAPTERGSGAALIGWGAGSTRCSRPAAAAPALTEPAAGRAAGRLGSAGPPRTESRSLSATSALLRLIC